MRKKLILFLMLALFGSANFLKADVIEIGDGTNTTYYTPFNSLYGYSFTEQVYLASEIGMAGNITSVSFYLGQENTAADLTNTYALYMKNVTRENFAGNTDYETVTAADLVFQGEWTIPMNYTGWLTITLDTPFAYDGTSNLMIGLHEQTSGYTTRYFSYTQSATNTVYQLYSDSSNPDPTDMASYSGSKAVRDQRSNIQLDITPGGGGGGTVSGELTVHDGTVTNGNVPVYGFYADAYLKCEMIYPAAELADMANGTINSIKFYPSSPATDAWTSTWQVFVSEVANATISDFYGPGTVVYEGTLDGTQAEMEITFDTPYAYNGGNLLIGVYNITTGNYKSVTWAGETVDGASVSGYDYNSLSGITATQRNFLPKTTFAYVSGSTPEPPVAGLNITPNPFELGYRPVNGWMDVYPVKLYNEGADLIISATMSNTAGINAFEMSEEIENVSLPTEEALEFNIIANAEDATPGEYTEEFTMFTIETRDITVIPVTANFYEAGEADIVETAKAINGDVIETPADLQANYNLYGMTEMKADAVYSIAITEDNKITAQGGDDFIAIYDKAMVDANHLTAEIEPVLLGTSGIINDEILLEGEYYLVVASNNITNITVNFVEVDPAEELAYIAPVDGATEVEAPVTLTWEGGDNATEYQVLFGTSPVNMGIALDWTLIDENYGSFEVADVDNNTQYFWQINVRNSKGTVEGPRYGFTTTLVAPNTVTASATEIFTDESTLIKWKHSAGEAGFTGEVTVCDGTSTSSYVPVYGLWMDDYTRGEMIYPAEMLEEMEGGEINKLTFYISSAASGAWSGDVFNVYLTEVEGTTLSAYHTSADATIVYTGALDGQGTTMVINFTEPYTYEGGNLLVGIEETVCGTYKSCSFYGVAATGASASGYSSASLADVTFNQRDFLPKVTFTCGDVRNNVRGFMHYNVYVDGTQVNDEPIYEKQYLLSNLEYNMEGHDVAVTAVYDEGESPLSTPVKVYVSGYSTFTGTVTELISGTPIEGVTVKFNGKDEFENTVDYQGTTGANGKYTITNVKVGNYVGMATLEGNEPSFSDAVTLEYANPVVPMVVDFQMHEVYNPVLSVVAEEMDSELARVRWSMNVNIPVPNPGGNGGGGATATTFEEGFESGMPEGWTVVDANNDGWTWCLTSAIPTTWTYYASLTLDWYRTGSNAICSGSYINGVGALTPDEYLVMGQVNLVSGSTLSFWGAATDANYAADHFGVFVSDDGNAWTSVQEWTMTGKSNGNGGRASRDGNGAKLGSWHNFTVDLSAYAGQKYLAIRHFNCTDQYIMVIDDIELGIANKSREVETYAVYRKAILKEAELVEADSVFFGTTTDTLYADFGWANVEPGLYQYGVSAHYPKLDKGTRAEIVYDFENGQIPAEFDNTSTYPWAIAQANGGKVIKSGNAGISSSTSEISLTVDYPSDGTFSFDAECMGEGTSTFWDKCTFSIDGTQQFQHGADLAGWHNYAYEIEAGTHTFTWSYSKDSSVNPTGDYFAIDNITLSYMGGGDTNDDPITPITWSNILPKDMETNVIVNAIVAAGSPEGATVHMANTFENRVYTGTFDETGTIVFEDFRKGNYVVTVALEGYTSTYAETVVSIWEETEINAILEEIFKPIDVLNVAVTGYASWNAVVPTDRVAEKYFVQVEGVFIDETYDNFMDLEDYVAFEENETYTVGVAVVYSTGMSPYFTKQFTYLGCEGVDHQVEDLTVDEEASSDLNVALVWNGGTPTPPTPPTPPTGDVVVKLTAHNVWGDGTGYQMLLDNTHSLYGSTIPTSGALSTNCSGNDAIYAQFSHKIPTNADGVCSTSNMVLDGTVEITIPAGTYDWCITNPTPGDRIWIAAANGNVGGRYDDYVFEGGHTYEFTVSMYGSNDGVDVTITGGKSMNQPNMGIMSNDVKTNNFFANYNLMHAGEGFGAAENQLTRDWYYYDNGVNEDAIGTNGGNFWWGIMLPAGSYEGDQLTKVAAYDYMAMTGTATIYQGGTSAPAGTALGSVNVTFTGSEDFREFEFAEPVVLDPTQNVWVIFYNGSGATFPAAVCANTGDANGRWVSLDGSTWADLASYDLDNTFMVRAFIEAGGPAPVQPTTGVTPNAFNIALDDIDNIIGAVTGNSAIVTAPDMEMHIYYVFYVDAEYGMSCPAFVNYSIALGVNENDLMVSIYPNPTSGNVRIEAHEMSRISIVNALGQVVYNKTVNGNEASVDMAQFGNGIYMVNITTANGTTVKRIVVNK